MASVEDDLISSIIGDEEADDGIDEAADSTAVEEDIKEEVSDEEADSGQEESEQKPAEDVEEKGKSETPMVPAGLLAEQRRQARAERERAEQLSRQLTQFQDTFNRLKQEREEQRKAADPMPDPNERPADYLSWQNRQMKSELNQVQEKLKTQEEREAQIARQRQMESDRKALLGHIAEREKIITSQHDDYYEALEYMRQPLLENLLFQGIDEAEANNRIAQHEFNQAIQLMQNGYDPAHYFYTQAKRSGFVSKGKSAVKNQENPQKQENEFEDKLKSIEQGKSASKTLSQSGGVDTDDILEMSENDFSLFEEAMREAGII